MSAPTLPDARGGHLRVLYSFDGVSGDDPIAGLTQYKGFLYGGAVNGGAGGWGTIYRLSVTGKLKVMHAFDQADGADPQGELLPMAGKLYGLASGGPQGAGEIYALTSSGKFSVVYAFALSDGAQPQAGLVQVAGTLYGTTQIGGRYNEGTVFALNPSGHLRVLHDFGSYSGDGTQPGSTLVFWRNKLYGTTSSGGTYDDGTAFSIALSGKEEIVYSLGAATDGIDPTLSTITPLNGLLYGTTQSGGTHGQGVVFVIGPSGSGRTLYNFGDSADDGSAPLSGVVAYRGALYGTTNRGGSQGMGTIFRVTAGGKETVEFSFSGGNGQAPWARLLLEGSNLYGTTLVGGRDSNGTAFRFTP